MVNGSGKNSHLDVYFSLSGRLLRLCQAQKNGATTLSITTLSLTTQPNDTQHKGLISDIEHNDTCWVSLGWVSLGWMSFSWVSLRPKRNLKVCSHARFDCPTLRCVFACITLVKTHWRAKSERKNAVQNRACKCTWIWQPFWREKVGRGELEFSHYFFAKKMEFSRSVFSSSSRHRSFPRPTKLNHWIPGEEKCTREWERESARKPWERDWGRWGICCNRYVRVMSWQWAAGVKGQSLDSKFLTKKNFVRVLKFFWWNSQCCVSNNWLNLILRFFCNLQKVSDCLQVVSDL